MAAEQAIQAFDHRHPIIIDPSEIRPGDWMRDLGTLRQVESVTATNDRSKQGTAISVWFVNGIEGQYDSLSVPQDVTVTVWRTPAEAAGDSRV